MKQLGASLLLVECCLITAAVYGSPLVPYIAFVAVLTIATRHWDKISDKLK
jgi:hypothetical protein